MFLWSYELIARIPRKEPAMGTYTEHSRTIEMLAQLREEELMRRAAHLSALGIDFAAPVQRQLLAALLARLPLKPHPAAPSPGLREKGRWVNQ